MPSVDTSHCNVALEHCAPFSFEEFAQAFHAAIVGKEFVPLGGVHDGGADGFEERVFEAGAPTTVFMQASKTPDFAGKIRQTIRRLREFGRAPDRVAFYFSHNVPNIDKVQEDLSDELGCNIIIRHRGYIIAQVNYSAATQSAYYNNIHKFTIFLENIGSATGVQDYPFDTRTLCAFLSQEVENRRGRSRLLTSVVDSLILWALEGTDPATGKLMSPAEIYEKIIAAVPTARHFARGSLDARLRAMRERQGDVDRRVSWHRREDRYALRYEERQRIAQENADDASLRVELSESFRSSFTEQFSRKPKIALAIEAVTGAMHRIIERIFSEQGLSISYISLSDETDANTKIDAIGIIQGELETINSIASEALEVNSWAARELQRIIYNGNDRERAYMQKLARTYFVLFLMKNEPQVVEYFHRLGGKNTLLVGSDILIQALAEQYISPEHRSVCNALAVLNASGSHLVLEEMALEEVYTHLIAADMEFKNHYASVENLIDADFTSVIDRILIRAYFYARNGLPGTHLRPRSWSSFIGQFCDYSGLQNKSSVDGFRAYLCDRFKLEFEERSEILKHVHEVEAAGLTEQILLEKGSTKPRAAVLARNDALHILRVYSRRAEDKETMMPTPYGYRTWWLTHEDKVRRASAKYFKGTKAPAIMRPEYLLSYIALNPEKRDVVDSFATVFPSALGIELGRQLDIIQLRSALEAVREAYAVDESRARVMIAGFADKLKADQLRVYDAQLSPRREIEDFEQAAATGEVGSVG